ncbi:MAG: DoxX-like family protein, partial [Acetobacteraceae bacterium]|nr:DoxX-like family protein [Acetobacteraceae bacterium]
AGIVLGRDHDQRAQQPVPAAWAELVHGVDGDPARWITAGGAPPRPLAATLRSLPATVQERWFARLWALKPLVIGMLAVFWVLSGAIGLARFEAAQVVLTARGVADLPAALAVGVGAAVDLLLGAAVLVRRWVVPAACGMLAVTAAYLLGASILAPDLWLDPLGPLVKTLPAAVLALVAIALAPER